MNPMSGSRPSSSTVVMLRILMSSFVLAVVVICVVSYLLRSTDGDDGSAGLAVGIVAAVGVGGLAVGRSIVPLDCSSDQALVATYRARFFVRVAMAEAPTLVGFVVAFALGPWWVTLVGGAFSLVGFALAAPTAANLRRDEEVLRQRGCERWLTEALGGR